MSIEAMKQALEALKWASDQINPQDGSWCQCPICKAITALRTDITEAEKQAPVAFYVYEWINPSDSTVSRSLRPDEHQFGRGPDRTIAVPTPPAAQPAPTQKREHITDGNPCWCNPEINYVDPETGAAVIIHRRPQ